MAELPYGSGFMPSVDPTRVGDGFPDCQNIMLEVGKSGIRAIDGSMRKTGASLASGGNLDLITFDPTLVGVASGQGLAVVDNGDGSRVLGVQMHKGFQTINFAATATQQLTRRGDNQYPAMPQLHGNTYHSDGRNPMRLFDGKETRLAGIRAPRRAPQLKSQTTADNQVHSMDSGWTTSAGPEVTIAFNTNDNKEGTGALEITWLGDLSISGNPLAGITGSPIFTFGAGDDRLGFWVKPNRIIAASTLKWIFNSTDVVIDAPLFPDVWQWIELDIPGSLQSTAITSIDIDVNSAALQRLGIFEDPSIILIDDLRRMTAVAGELTGTYLAAFGWIDPDRIATRISNPSPRSNFVKFSGQSAEIDVDGQDTEDSSNVTDMRVYLQKDAIDPGRLHKVIEETISTTTTSVNVTDNDIVSGETVDYLYAVPPACKYAQVYGERICWAAFEDHTDGTAAVTNGSDTVTGSATNWSRFMEGMNIRIGTEDKVYTIFEVDVGAQTMTISACLNDFGTPDFSCAYAGSTDASASYRIFGNENLVFFTSFDKSLESPSGNAYSEAVAVTNFISVFPNDGDSIVGLALLNGVLFIAKRQRCFFAVQNFGTSDSDTTSIQFNAAQILTQAVGVVAPRSIAALPDGRVIFLGTNNHVYVVSLTEGVQTLPGSDQVQAFFDDFTSAQIESAVGAYEGRLRSYVLHVEQKVLRYDFVNQGFYFDSFTNGVTVASMSFVNDDDAVNQLIAGTDAGHLERLYDPASSNFASLGAAHVYAATAGTGTTVTIDTGPGNLATANGGLAGRRVVVIDADDKTVTQDVSISSNTASVITVGAFSPDPAVGDIVLIDPIDAYVEFVERQFKHFANLEGFIADLRHGADLLLYLKLFVSSGRGFNAQMASAARTFAIDVARLETGDRNLGLQGGLDFRAIRYRLQWWKQNNDLTVRRVFVDESKIELTREEAVA